MLQTYAARVWAFTHARAALTAAVGSPCSGSLLAAERAVGAVEEDVAQQHQEGGDEFDGAGGGVGRLSGRRALSGGGPLRSLGGRTGSMTSRRGGWGSAPARPLPAVTTAGTTTEMTADMLFGGA